MTLPSPVLLLLDVAGGVRLVFADGRTQSVDSRADLPTVATPGRVILSPPLAWCLAASLPTADLPKADRQAALLYRLEERLPWDAEAMAAAFVMHPTQALGLAIETARIAPVLDELERAGWQVEAVVPWPLLAACASPAVDGLLLHEPQSRDAVSAGTADVAWVTLRDGKPSQWLQLARDEIPHECARRAAQHLPVVAWYGPDAPAGVTPHVQHPMTLAAAGAVQALGNPLEVPGDLRIGALAKGDRLQRLSRPLVLAWITACLFLALVCVVFWRRAQSYQAVEAHCMAADRQLFQELHPGDPVPIGVGSRLDALARTLPPPGQQVGDVLDPLHDLLKGLATAPTLQIEELQLRPTQVFLSGQAPSAAEVAKISQALAGDFTWDAPRSERQPQGVQFTLTGQPKGGVR